VHVYVVFAHPSKESFTWQVLRFFERGLREAGHTVEIADLYAMGFQTDMDLAQYERETGPYPDAPVAPDVKREQDNIAAADGVVFLYPVWWSDCPAKLKGWFDRVLTHGYAYLRDGWADGRKTVAVEKALVLCPAGQTREKLEQQGIGESMRTIMLDDRVHGLGAREARMEILGGTGDEMNRRRNLEHAYELGKIFGFPSEQKSGQSKRCCG
jgi:NAD(P)H dehydrogenase (quinone)